MDYLRSIEKTRKLKEATKWDSFRKGIEKRQETRFWKIIEKQKSCKKCWLIQIYEEREYQDNKKDYCSRSCANSKVHTLETKRKISDKLIVRVKEWKNIHFSTLWYKHTENEKNKISESQKKRYQENPLLREYQSVKMKEIAKTRIITDEMRLKYSEDAKRREFWGKTSKKAIYYKQKDWTIVYLQSSYEVTVATELDTNNILWRRPKPFLWTDSIWKQHRYYPDFFLEDFNIYLDPKNDYLITIDKEKIESVQTQNWVTILILNKSELSWKCIESKVLLCNK